MVASVTSTVIAHRVGGIVIASRRSRIQVTMNCTPLALKEEADSDSGSQKHADAHKHVRDKALRRRQEELKQSSRGGKKCGKDCGIVNDGRLVIELEWNFSHLHGKVSCTNEQYATKRKIDTINVFEHVT